MKSYGSEVSDAFWSCDDPYDKFPADGDASDILRLKGLLGLDRRKLKVTIPGDWVKVLRRGPSSPVPV